MTNILFQIVYLVVLNVRVAQSKKIIVFNATPL